MHGQGEAKLEMKNDELSEEEQGVHARRGPDPRARWNERTTDFDTIPSKNDYTRGGLSGTPGTSAPGRHRHNGNAQATGLITQHAWSDARVHVTLQNGLASHAERHEGVGIAPEGRPTTKHEGVGIILEGTRSVENLVTWTSVQQELVGTSGRKSATAISVQSTRHQTDSHEDGVVTEYTPFEQALAIAKRNATGHSGDTQPVHAHGEAGQTSATGPEVPAAQLAHGSTTTAGSQEKAMSTANYVPFEHTQVGSKRSAQSDGKHSAQTVQRVVKRPRLTAVDLDMGETQGRPSRHGSIIKGAKTERLAPAVDDGGHELIGSQRPENARRPLFREHIKRRGGTHKKEEPITIRDPKRRPRVRGRPKAKIRTSLRLPQVTAYNEGKQARQVARGMSLARVSPTRLTELAGVARDHGGYMSLGIYHIMGVAYSHEELLRFRPRLNSNGRVTRRWLIGFHFGTPRLRPTGTTEAESQPQRTPRPIPMRVVPKVYQPPGIRPRVRSRRLASKMLRAPEMQPRASVPGPTLDNLSGRVYTNGDLHAIASMFDMPHTPGTGEHVILSLGPTGNPRSSVGLSHRIGQEPSVLSTSTAGARLHQSVLSGSSGTGLRQPSLATRDDKNKANKAQNRTKKDMITNKCQSRLTMSDERGGTNRDQTIRERCSHCGKTGHVAQHCWFNPTSEEYRTGYAESLHQEKLKKLKAQTNTDRCSYCGRMGHAAQYCRQNPTRRKVNCNYCGRRGHLAQECRSNPQSRRYRMKYAAHDARTERRQAKRDEMIANTAKRTQANQHERVNTIQVRHTNEEERVNTATEGRRQRTTSADAAKKKATAYEQEDDEDPDMKPKLEEQRALEKVCGDPLRTLGFRPDPQQDTFYGLMQKLETRMSREDTAVKRSVMNAMDTKVEGYITRVEIVETGLKKIREELKKAEAGATSTAPAANETRAGQEEHDDTQGDKRTPKQEAWMHGVEGALQNIWNGLERSMNVISNTLVHHNQMFMELYEALNIVPPPGNMPPANYRGEDRDGEDGGRREDDLEGSHRLGDGGADYTSQPSEHGGGTSQQANDVATQQVNQDAGQTQEKEAGTPVGPTTGVAPEDEQQRQQEVGAGENGSHELPTVGDATTGIPDGGADDLVMTNRGVFARREHNPVLDIAREKFTQHPVAPPVPPIMLFKPPSERVNAIGVSWKGSFEGNMEEDIDLFLDEFELHCVSNGVDPTLKAATLRLRLTGMARTLVAAMPATDRASYDKITGKLRATFNRPDRYLAAREKIDRLPYGGSLSDFIVRLVPLMQRAYPDASEEVREVKTFDLIMDRAPSNVRMELKRAKCHTLAEVIRCGPEAEALAKDLAKEMGRRQAQPVNATYTETEVTNVGIVGSRLDAPHAPRPSRFDRVTPPRYKPNRTPTRAQTQPRVDRPEGRQAFGGQQSTRNQSFGSRNLASRTNVTCGHCGRNGHAAIYCWRNPQSQYYKPGFGEPRMTGQEYTPQRYARRVQPSPMQFQQPQREPIGYIPQQQIGYNPEPQMQVVPQIQCHTCGGVGHIARQCPSGYRVQGSSSAPNLRHGGGQIFQGNDIQQLTHELAMMRTGNRQGQGGGGANPVMQVMHQSTPQTQVLTAIENVVPGTVGRVREQVRGGCVVERRGVD